MVLFARTCFFEPLSLLFPGIHCLGRDQNPRLFGSFLAFYPQKKKQNKEKGSGQRASPKMVVPGPRAPECPKSVLRVAWSIQLGTLLGRFGHSGVEGPNPVGRQVWSGVLCKLFFTRHNPGPLLSLSPKAGHNKAGRPDFRNQRFEPDTGKMRKIRKGLSPYKNKGLRRLCGP